MPRQIIRSGLLGRENLEGVVGCTGDIGIVVRGEVTQLRLETRGADIAGDEQDDRQALAPSNGFGH